MGKDQEEQHLTRVYPVLANHLELYEKGRIAGSAISL